MHRYAETEIVSSIFFFIPYYGITTLAITTL